MEGHTKTTGITFCALSALLVACGEDDEGGTGAFCGGTHPVESAFQASRVAGDIAGAIEDAVSRVTDGSGMSPPLSGDSGSITLNGSVSRYNGLSCGSSCVTSGNNTSLTATFSSYTEPGGIATISGSVDYTDTTSSTQSGLSFFTSGSISISNNNTISYDATNFDTLCNPPTNGTIDSITSISSSGDSSSSSQQSGTLTGSGGFFSF